MSIFIDMVHDNPGETPFETRYRNPAELAGLGLNGQVNKHIHTAVPFDFLGRDLFPAGSEEREWFNQQIEHYQAGIERAENAGLSMYHHIDLFLFPIAVVERFRDQMCLNGRISIRKKKTRELLRGMLNELFALFPDLNGLIIRVGETYLHGLPHHTGNSAVAYGDDLTAEQQDFVQLINLLREVVCTEQNRKLIFRTWDCYPDRFHADPDYYLAVTDQVAPHENLIFSIKHTALDFWRHVNFNPCLGKGRHPQVVEVQIQREYEGKGAFPMYPVGHVLNGFPEIDEPVGLAQLADNPLFAGVYCWCRGGGWHGPYIRHEFWIDLNMAVLAEWMKNTARSEKDCFTAVAKNRFGLDDAGAETFHQLCFSAAAGVLAGRYCEVFDCRYNGSRMPTCNWMRDDHLGGKRQLGELFQWLETHDAIDEALAEKKRCTECWDEISRMAEQVHFADEKTQAVFETSVEYGRRLFRMIYEGWRILSGAVSSLEDYELALAAYSSLPEDRPFCATLFQSERRIKDYKDEVGESDDCMRDSDVVRSASGFDSYVRSVAAAEN